MDYPIRLLSPAEFPSGLREIPQPPRELFIKGELPPITTKHLAVVGSRNYSNYGKQVVEHLIRGLRGYPISIISGLAVGIDALAHETALEAELYTLAVPGSGLEERVLYPARNRRLAQRILESGGGLLSEYSPTQEAAPWTFPQRNRIMAGISHAILLIEATEKSGTLITARLAVEYNRDLLAVPGSIFSDSSKGTHQFLKLGATLVTSSSDILEALHIDEKVSEKISDSLTNEERHLLTALATPCERDALIRLLALSAPKANVLFMSMELRGLIRESNGIFYKV